MNEKLEQRLKELRYEFESGQKMLADLETRQADLKSTLLRISGAIQVLEELLGQEGGDAASPDGKEHPPVGATDSDQPLPTPAQD